MSKRRLTLYLVAAGVLLLLLAAYVVNPLEEAVDHVAAPVARELGVASSPASVKCLEGWTETAGRDPDGNIKMKVCTSPDKATIITVRENQAPVGFDGHNGRFLTPEEVAGFLR